MGRFAGKHVARAVEAKLGYTSTGSEQVAVAFEVTEGELRGQTLTWFGYFSEKTVQRTLESLRNCGWQGTDISDLSTVGSRECQIVVEEEVDQEGTARDRVRWVNALGAGRVQLKSEMGDEAKRAFAARMRALAAGVKALEPTAPVQKPKAAPAPTPHERAKADGYSPDPEATAPFDGDDVPF